MKNIYWIRRNIKSVKENKVNKMQATEFERRWNGILERRRGKNKEKNMDSKGKEIKVTENGTEKKKIHYTRKKTR